MVAQRRAPGDIRAARSQLRTADQSARVGKEARADSDGAEVTVPLRDQEFKLGHSPSVMSLMEWGASSGGGSLIAAFHVLKDIVHEDDWEEFKEYCRDENVESEEMGTFINAAMEGLSGRPTEAATG